MCTILALRSVPRIYSFSLKDKCHHQLSLLGMQNVIYFSENESNFILMIFLIDATVIQYPVYFAFEDETINSILDDIQTSDISNQPASSTTGGFATRLNILLSYVCITYF